MLKQFSPTPVSIVRCTDYQRDKTMSAVRESVELLGGMQAFIKSGERVLIKPNLLKANAPEDAVTTHPEIVRAVIRLVHEVGGKPMVGDSPGIGSLEKVCEKAGLMAVIKEESAELVDMEDVITVRNNGQFQRFEIARAAYEADAIINVPKFKTHGMTVFTGAVKNLFGCVPGKRKVQAHFNSGVNHEHFARMLVELCFFLKPRLSIMDAVVGMEGNGPGSGDPRPVGLIIAGQDPSAVDVVSAEVVGVRAEKLPLIRAAAKIGKGQTELSDITIIGESPANVRVGNFRLPVRQMSTEWLLPEWMRRSLKNAFTTRPVIKHGRCPQCGICLEHCPQHAISLSGKRLEINYRDCIRCFCCQEFCPRGAISVEKGWALKLRR